MSHDPFETLAELRRELSRCQQRVTDLVNQLNALSLPTPAELRCPTCGIVAPRGPRQLAEHVYVSHGGDLPAHWLEVDRRAGLAE